jgi:hypothetical protein
LRKCQKCVEELKFCMNELFNDVFKAFTFLKFREVHFGSFWKKLLGRNMWKVYTRPSSASNFFSLNMCFRYKKSWYLKIRIFFRKSHQYLPFYLPHMEYEGSIGFVMRKMKNFYCWFSRFRTFYGLKTWFERLPLPLPLPLRLPYAKFALHLQAWP